MRKQPIELWLRISDGPLENFGHDDLSLIDALRGCGIRAAGIKWHVLPEAGFSTNLGTNVDLYWGDKDGRIIRPITHAGEKDIVRRLRLLEEKEKPWQRQGSSPVTRIQTGTNRTMTRRGKTR